MAWLLLSFLTGLAVIMLVHGLLAPGRFYQFPFLAAGIFLTFIVPQIPGLINNRFIADDALNKTLVFSILCLAMCWIGWALGNRGKGLMGDIVLSETRLLLSAGVMVLIGGAFYFLFMQLPDEERLRGMLTGRAVAFLFFAKLMPYGFAISILCYAKHPSKLALLIILVAASFYLDRIVIAGKRGETAEFFLLVALALWFQRGWAAPRAAVVGGLALAMVGLLGAGQYREATYYTDDPDWSSVLSIDLGQAWDRLLQEGGREMVNAVMAIDHIDQHQNFDFGLDHWNSIVFTYVPAQLVGQSVKDSLLIELPSSFERGYIPTTGSTWTGMADAFGSFWYFGWIKFLAIGWLMGRIYASARQGNTIMQLVYVLSLVPSMLSITHFTNEIVIAWIHMAAFLLPVFYFAALGRPRASALVANAAPSPSR